MASPARPALRQGAECPCPRSLRRLDVRRGRRHPLGRRRQRPGSRTEPEPGERAGAEPGRSSMASSPRHAAAGHRRRPCARRPGHRRRGQRRLRLRHQRARTSCSHVVSVAATAEVRSSPACSRTAAPGCRSSAPGGGNCRGGDPGSVRRRPDGLGGQHRHARARHEHRGDVLRGHLRRHAARLRRGGDPVGRRPRAHERPGPIAPAELGRGVPGRDGVRHRRRLRRRDARRARRAGAGRDADADAERPDERGVGRRRRAARRRAQSPGRRRPVGVEADLGHAGLGDAERQRVGQRAAVQGASAARAIRSSSR
ncbi:MAG: hypothetical protein MZW92_57250 [Comamonadaceae bacterium]|nr:hypothetical protein [Comamonadaceae bacterium]